MDAEKVQEIWRDTVRQLIEHADTADPQSIKDAADQFAMGFTSPVQLDPFGEALFMVMRIGPFLRVDSEFRSPDDELTSGPKMHPLALIDCDDEGE